MTVVFSLLFLLMDFSNFGLAADIVLTVNPTQVEAKRQETVVLDCQGNTRNLYEYIIKWVNWKHVANDGTIHKITTGFYLDDGADETKYDIQHGDSDNSDTNYSFKLKILSVNDDDDGKYVCEYVDRRFLILSSKEVQFTVINPVEKVNFEILTMMTGHRMYSESQIMANSVIYEVEEGDFEVTCTAEGSNPTPQMTLKFNNNVQQIDTKMVKSLVGNRPSYKGTFTKVISLSAYKTDIQTIECSGGIPRKQFPDKYAGLKLKVFSVVPDVECENMSALVRYRQTKLTCRFHSMRALDCSQINWNDGNNNFVIYPGNKIHDPSYGPVVVDCDSVTHENNSMTVTTSLTFDLVQDAHFDAVFYVEYSYGKHEHRYPMKLSMKGLAADIVLTVNPTQVEAQRQETVVLDCQGNTRQLTEYIIKRIIWKHVANDGTIHKITTGFYLDDGADKTKYDIQHGDSDNSDTNYSFKLKILSVVDDDDGKYVCEITDDRFVILSSKEVQVTVLNPVDKVKIELLTMTTGHRVYSETQIMTDSVIYEVEEGDFEVTCAAEGSNPTPQMTLKFNNNVQQVDTNMDKSVVGNRPSYKGTLTKLFSLSADKIDIQTIECSAGIPGKQFPDKYVGLKLKVFPVAPDVECENVYALVRYKQTKLTCRLHSMRALDCSHINWNDGNNNFVIYPGNKTHDPSYGPVVVDCDSVTHENISMTVTTSMTFDLVQDAHFDAVFYVEFSYGKHEHRYPVKLHMKVLAVDIVLSVNWTQVEAKRQETVVLDCQVNTRSVLEYISKPVNWKHVANDGTIRKITTGFYLDDGADKTKYDIQHGNSDNSDTNYSFKLKILSVVDDDDGKYVCEIRDDRFVILSSKEVQVTVLNPVDKVKIELLTMTTGHRVYSETQIMTDSVIYEVEEGDFEVTCTAEGSNPTPQMTLKFNNNVQQVDTNMDKSFVGNRPSYKGIFTKLFSLSADKIDIQTIECSAGIPRKQFPDQYAGLKLKVFPVVPDVECENVYALVRYKQTKLTCRFHSMRALDCSHINWNDGNNNFVIYPGNKTHDPSYGHVVVDCDSVTHENNSLTVTTSMTFDLVHDAHFDAVFYVEFSYGKHEHRYPVKLHMKGLAVDIVLTVKWTQVEAKRQETVVLDCQVNTRSVLEYISKPVNWKHVANDGTIHKITTGFYLDDGADKTKYDIQHGNSDNSDTNYSFKLKILSVVDDDDGKYVCEIRDDRFVTLSSKEVQVTVLNPVDKVKIELLTMTTGHRVYSETQIMTDSVIYEVEEGDFEVTCTAEGSNPTPQMTLKFNNNVQQVDTNMDKSFVGNRPSYKGTLTKLFSLSADKIDIQTIECSAGIPRKQFPDKYAGLKLKVFPVAPDVECENVYALVRYKQTKLTCRLHSMRALDCSHINWNDGNNNFVIYPGNKTHDSSYGPVVVDCDSVTHENNSMTVTTSLTFDLVQDAHFDAVFYVEFSYGKHEHRYPVKLHMKVAYQPEL